MAKKAQTKKPISEEYNIAFDFATKAYKRFQEIIKSVVLFGSVAKHHQTKKSDIDLIIFIDDCTVKWDEELIAWYREELAKLVSKQPYAKKLHVNTITMTTFWDEVRAGEPLSINILRYGETLVDYGGFFEPLKVLLAKGKVRPTPEAIMTTLERSEAHIIKSQWHILSAVEGLYWGCVDAAHAALMALDVIPPSPEFIKDLIKDFFVEKGYLNKKYLTYFEKVRKVAKSIAHGETKRISASELDKMQTISVAFIKALEHLTQQIIKDKKIIKVQPKKL